MGAIGFRPYSLDSLGSFLLPCFLFSSIFRPSLALRRFPTLFSYFALTTGISFHRVVDRSDSICLFMDQSAPVSLYFNPFPRIPP